MGHLPVNVRKNSLTRYFFLLLRILGFMMKDRTQIEQPVAIEFKRFNDEFAASLESSTYCLQSAIEHILHSTGKHIRPLLVLLTAKACGCVTENTINSAVLLELLHTATLIHDDVIDETKQRRGLPSLNAIFDNRISVLVGDFLLSSALTRSVQTGNLQIIGIVSKLGRDLSEGEIKQLETAEETIIDEACYMQVIRKKTAMLLSACMGIGAISADAPDEMVEKCRLVGKYLGYCFQIKDDIFDYFKDANIGKPTGNDIREGKVTLPLLFALRVGERDAAERFLRIIREKNFVQENVDRLIDFAKANGGIAYAEQRMREYHDRAIAILRTLPFSEARDSLLLLADYIVERQK